MKNYARNTKVKATLWIVGLGALMCCYNNCGSSADSAGSTSLSQSTGMAQMQMAAVVTDSSSKTYYSSTSSAHTSVTAGQPYFLQISGNPPTGTVLTATVSNMVTSSSGVKSLQTLSMPLVVGANTIPSTFLTQGSNNFVITAVQNGTQISSMSMNVNALCPNTTDNFGQTITKNGVTTHYTLPNTAGGITTTLTTNSLAGYLYSYDVSGVMSTAKNIGVPPFSCELDMNGSGILDTGLVPCTDSSGNVLSSLTQTGGAFDNLYVNYIGQRNVQLTVVDACGYQSTATVSTDVQVPSNFAYSSVNPSLAAPAYSTVFPGAAGDGYNFIYGLTSATAGANASDSRVSNVTYLATDPAPNNNQVVTVQYANGTATFNGKQQYNPASGVSTPFGIQIAISGLNIAYNTSSYTITGASGITTSGKGVTVTYSTDAGVGMQVLSYSGSCTLNKIGATPQIGNSGSCSLDGVTQYPNTPTVEIYGEYTCTGLKNSKTGDTMNLTGYFDGMYAFTGSCSAGGGANNPPVQQTL